MNTINGVGAPRSIFVPASRSSAATGDWVNFENCKGWRFIIDVGAVAAGGNVKFHKSAVAAGSSSAQIDFATYQKRTASSDTYTKTSANSSGSHSCITIGNSSDNKTFIVDVNAAELGSTYKFATVKVPAAFSAALTCVVAIPYGVRYQQDTEPTALS